MALSEAEKETLAAAIRDVEAGSRAEVVVTVRRRSDTYERGPAVLGATAAVAMLAFTLFSEREFSLPSIVNLPILAGLLVGGVARLVPALERLLSSPARRRHAVEQAARASFVERGVGHTRERTGILVCVSHLERQAVVVPDKGITDVMPPDAWAGAVAEVQRVAASAPGDIRGLAEALRSMGVRLARALPARADDVDELSNAVEVRS